MHDFALLRSNCRYIFLLQLLLHYIYTQKKNFRCCSMLWVQNCRVQPGFTAVAFSSLASLTTARALSSVLCPQTFREIPVCLHKVLIMNGQPQTALHLPVLGWFWHISHWVAFEEGSPPWATSPSPRRHSMHEIRAKVKRLRLEMIGTREERASVLWAKKWVWCWVSYTSTPLSIF